MGHGIGYVDFMQWKLSGFLAVCPTQEGFIQHQNNQQNEISGVHVHGDGCQVWWPKIDGHNYWNCDYFVSKNWLKRERILVSSQLRSF